MVCLCLWGCVEILHCMCIWFGMDIVSACLYTPFLGVWKNVSSALLGRWVGFVGPGNGWRMCIAGYEKGRSILDFHGSFRRS